MVGQQIDSWRIISPLEATPLGECFHVQSLDGTNPSMMIQILGDPLTTTSPFQIQFQAEMAVLRRLHHPQILRYYDHGIVDGHPYYVTPFIEGIDGETHFRKGARPTREQFLSVAMQLISAVQYGHRRGILHRNLHPGNLIFTPDGKIIIAQFGIAKLFQNEANTTPKSLFPLYYYVPELVSGKPLGKRSDFYSIGNILYTYLTGRPPFVGQNAIEQIQKVCFALPERPIHYVPDLPIEIDRFVMRLLAKEPDQRPGSSTLLLEECDRIWQLLERRKQIHGKKPELFKGSSETQGVSGTTSQSVELEEIDFEENRSFQIPTWLRAIGLSTALLGIIAILIWAFFYRTPTAEKLFEQAKPLMESDDPADWDRAWNEYLEPLARRYPDHYSEAIADLRWRVESQRRLRNALMVGRVKHYASEAERFYAEGIYLCQAGEFDLAASIWKNLILLFANSPGDERWIKLAQQSLQKLDKPVANGVSSTTEKRTKSAVETIQMMLSQIEKLKSMGKIEEANRIRSALIDLYRYDPVMKEFPSLLTRPSP